MKIPKDEIFQRKKKTRPYIRHPWTISQIPTHLSTHLPTSLLTSVSNAAAGRIATNLKEEEKKLMETSRRRGLITLKPLGCP
jgi:hypothetical protein